MTIRLPKRRRTSLLLTAQVALLLAAGAARANHSVFFYQLDSAGIVGNASGGAGCFEDFAAGLGGWFPALGNPVASGGFVEFENPGEVSGAFLPFYDVLLEREDIQAPATCDVVAGGGNATYTTEWVNAVPNLPGDFYGHQFVYAVSLTFVEAIIVSVTRLDAGLAAEFGLPPGLFISQSKLQLDSTDPDDIVLASPIDTQLAPISEAELAGATGGRVYLRLVYDQDSVNVVASYSLDGGASYQSPFTAVDVGNFGFVPARFWATGAAATRGTNVPALSRLAGTLLAGLLVAASLGILRTRR